jgi:methylglutaconyl-CoA hydratase
MDSGYMTYSNLLVTIEGGAATVKLNRPERHNAFDETMIAELTDAFVKLNRDDAVRAIILDGEGDSFCAGADLEWMGKMAGFSREQNLEDARALQRMFATIDASPKPTIARVHGAAYGGGAGLVAVCDVSLAGKDAKFGFTEARLGIVPAVIAPYVVRKVGLGAAQALFVTGERFGPDVALRVGLVQEVEAFDLAGAVQKRVNAILQCGPKAIAEIKRLLRSIEGRAADQVAEETTSCIAELRVSPEGQEGIRAFLEKRNPSWSCQDAG